MIYDHKTVIIGSLFLGDPNSRTNDIAAAVNLMPDAKAYILNGNILSRDTRDRLTEKEVAILKKISSKAAANDAGFYWLAGEEGRSNYEISLISQGIQPLPPIVLDGPAIIKKKDGADAVLPETLLKRHLSFLEKILFWLGRLPVLRLTELPEIVERRIFQKDRLRSLRMSLLLGTKAIFTNKGTRHIASKDIFELGSWRRGETGCFAIVSNNSTTTVSVYED